jgi:hypothetical protein
MRLETLSKLKEIHLIGTGTRDLPACSIVPQPTTLLKINNVFLTDLLPPLETILKKNKYYNFPFIEV